MGLGFVVRALPAQAIRATKAAEFNRAILTYLDRSSGLPFIVDQAIQYMIGRFRLHIAAEYARN